MYTIQPMADNNPLESVPSLAEEHIEQRAINAVVIQGYDSPEYIKHQAEIERIKEQGEFLNYDTSPMEWRCFSSIDEKDKYTKRLVDCTGVVIFGKRKDSNEIISCISHSDEMGPLSESINPVVMARVRILKDRYRAELEATILDLRTQLSVTSPDEDIEVWDKELDIDVFKNKRKYLEEELIRVQGEIDYLAQDHGKASFLEFDNEVQQKLSEFKAMVDPSTVTASVFGGQTLKIDVSGDKDVVVEVGNELENKNAKDAYNLGVKMWKEYIISHFGFEPSVAHEPLTIRGKRHGTDVYVNTQGRKVFVIHRTAQA